VNPTEELPTLSPDLIADEEALEAWVDDAIRLDPLAEARWIEIAEWTGWLRDGCEPDLWKLVLEIDARVRERWLDLGLVFVRLGFESGRRHPLVAEEGSP